MLVQVATPHNWDFIQVDELIMLHLVSQATTCDNSWTNYKSLRIDSIGIALAKLILPSECRESRHHYLSVVELQFSRWHDMTFSNASGIQWWYLSNSFLLCFSKIFQHTVGDTDILCVARAWGPPDRLAMCEKVLGVKAFFLLRMLIPFTT